MGEISEKALGSFLISWEDVRYRRARAMRDGEPFGYVYIVDEGGDWHKHDGWGWHSIERRHRHGEG